MLSRTLASLGLALSLVLGVSLQAARADGCSFVLGFRTLHDLIPAVVGQCVENENHNPANGDALQRTTNGLLVWRKLDNWTAFTDGFRTWINGPQGIAERLNTERFAWEANPDGLPVVGNGAGALPPISVRQPQPYDLVDLPVAVSGVGTGFEGVIAARLRDGAGRELVRRAIHAGGTGILGNYAATLAPATTPATAEGTLEVFETSPKGDGTELNKVVVPITFGPVLLSPFHGFAQYTAASGDTLGSVAQRWYGDPNRSARIAIANRDRLGGGTALTPGLVLRIPQ